MGLLIFTQFFKKNIGPYLASFGNYRFFCEKNAKKRLPRAIPTRSAKFFFLCTPSHSYQSIKKKSKSIPAPVLKFWVRTRFVTPTPTPTPTPTTNDAAKDHNPLSGQSPSG